MATCTGAAPAEENDENAGPCATSMPEDTDLALAYREKYKQATSSIHQKWVVFFEHALMRQVLKTQREENRAAAGVTRQFSSLVHARVAALKMLDAALDVERRRRVEFLGLRRRCRAYERMAPPKKRRRVGSSPLLRAASLADDRLFDRIASFV